LPKDRHHYYKSDPNDPYEYYWIHFNGVGFENFLNAISLTEDNPVIFNVENSKIEQCFKDLITICKTPDDFGNLLVLSKAYSLLYEISSAIPSQKEEKEKNFNLVIETAINYITEHYQSKVTLDDLATITYTNKCYLVTLFKKVTGLTPIQYLIQHRVNQACALLQTNMSVTEICYKCGFTELTNFLVRFKRITGITPSEFRKNLKANTQ
jgi:AraC-like DNA-binding protein